MATYSRADAYNQAECRCIISIVSNADIADSWTLATGIGTENMSDHSCMRHNLDASSLILIELWLVRSLFLIRSKTCFARSSESIGPLEHPHASILPARHIVGSIAGTWEMRRTIFIPSELLRADRPSSPSTHVIPHTVVDNPVFSTVRAGSETGVAHAISLFHGILVEDAAFVILLPVSWIHGVGTDEFELAEAVVAVVAAGGGVNDKFLACLWVGELLRAFVGGEAVVFAAAVGGLFPCVLRHTTRKNVSIYRNHGDRE